MLVIACLLFSALAVVSRPPDNGLIVEMLEFQDGLFAQYVHPVHDETILGKWAAEIVTEDGREVCSGGGSAPYELKKEPKRMTPDQWTGDVCILTEGQLYVANAVWQWTGPEGHPHAVSRSMTFRYSSGPV
jgi:hypothetical protein